MVREPFHLSDQDILLVVDGEASRRRAREVRSHLAACWACRSRLGELEGAIQDFVALRQQALEPQLPPAKGPRAVLKARLADAARPSVRFEAISPIATRPWASLLCWSPAQRAAGICAALLITVLGARFFQQLESRGAAPEDFSVASLAVPNHALTPGATRPITLGDVCSMPHEEVVREVPGSLSQEVFKEYGIANPRPEDYEIDYLIAPGLGGTEDLQNLWPEPAKTAGWNAHVKDALEERLHQLVCAGQVDLPTAQRAIATDWITAYKKYLGGGQYFSQASKFSSGLAEVL